MYFEVTKRYGLVLGMDMMKAKSATKRLMTHGNLRVSRPGVPIPHRLIKQNCPYP